MLSPKTLRVMTTLSNGNKIRAEQEAADTARRLAVLDGQAETLAAYTADLGRRLVQADIGSGLELRAYGQFIEMGLRAKHRNEADVTSEKAAQQVALDNLAMATEKHKSLQRAAENAQAASDLMAERAVDHSAGAGAASIVSGKRGRTGFAPPEARHASRRQT